MSKENEMKAALMQLSEALTNEYKGREVDRMGFEWTFIERGTKESPDRQIFVSVVVGVRGIPHTDSYLIEVKNGKEN